MPHVLHSQHTRRVILSTERRSPKIAEDPEQRTSSATLMPLCSIVARCSVCSWLLRSAARSTALQIRSIPSHGPSSARSGPRLAVQPTLISNRQKCAGCSALTPSVMSCFILSLSGSGGASSRLSDAHRLLSQPPQLHCVNIHGPWVRARAHSSGLAGSCLQALTEKQRDLMDSLNKSGLCGNHTSVARGIADRNFRLTVLPSTVRTTLGGE